MKDFLGLIPQAATSPYAFAAYAICATLFVLVGARLRTVRSVLKELKQVPKEDRRRVIESVTNSVIPSSITAEEWIRSNRNRSLFQLGAIVVLLGSAISVIAILGAGNTIKPPPPEALAAVEAHAFLAKLDAGDYAGAYQQMADEFKPSYPLQRWLTTSSIYRAPLGSTINRIDVNSAPGQSAFRGKNYNIQSYTFSTKFSKRDQSVAEFVSLASLGVPDPWHVVSYQIGVDPNAPNDSNASHAP